MRNLKYIFCGNSGGGTSFVANYLSSCGFLCGHEMFGFNISENSWYTGPSGNVLVDGTPISEIALGESSYIASEWYNYKPMDILPVIMIIRNPLHVLNSSIIQSVYHGETIDINSNISVILKKYQLVENNPRTVFKFRIEYDLEQLCNFLQIEYKTPVGTKTKTHNNGRINLQMKDIVCYQNYALLKDFFERYGYKE